MRPCQILKNARPALRPAALAAALILTLVPPARADRPERPNIIFIMVDDLGPEWVSCYGAEEIETPNIDRLAARGMKFLNAYSMPQCTPTRATLLTGQYPFRHGWVNHWDVPRWGAGCSFDWKHNPSFARLLKEAGYATGVAGKWQINDFRVQPDALREHGFDEWCLWTGFESGNKPSAERYWDPYIFTNVELPGFRGPTSNVTRHDIGRSGTFDGRFGPDVYNAFCLDFIRRHKGEPFLLYYPMALTHGPLVQTPHEPDVTGKLDRHKAMVRYTDHLVGLLVGALIGNGVRERTILIFTTDNGTSRAISGRMNGRVVKGGKARVTENGPRQPFIVSCPGVVPEGVETDCLTDFTDLLPTFCELAGAPLPEGEVVDGKSIAAVLLGEQPDGPREWIMAMGHGPARLDERGVRPVQDFTHRVLRDKRYKIHVSDDREVTALYDLQKDPGEESNLLSRGPLTAAQQAALEKLTAALDTMPERDGRPQYDPTPPQPWDRQP